MATEVVFHLFRYPTHAVVWTTHYNRPPGTYPWGRLSTPDGGELFVFCNLFLTDIQAYTYCFAKPGSTLIVHLGG